MPKSSLRPRFARSLAEGPEGTVGAQVAGKVPVEEVAAVWYDREAAGRIQRAGAVFT